ncbi:MAG: O-antigen ligase family protein [Thermoanaerobaculia bacterium]
MAGARALTARLSSQRMARRSGRLPDPAPEESVDSRANAPTLFVIGVLAALTLPFLFFSAASSDALRETKLLVQALGAALAMLALARRGAIPVLGRRPAVRVAILGLFAGLALTLLSGFSNADVVDPLTAAAILSPLALLLAGASRAGARVAPAAAIALMAAGAATGALAALQRRAGLFRLPLEVPEPRFLAAGLIGNAGDVGMALVVPSLLLFTRAAEPGTHSGERSIAAFGLLATLLGLVATEAVAPALAFGAGAAAFVALDFRRRSRALAALLAAALLAAATGAGRRFLLKLDELGRGDLASATTQRDIGLLAGREMLRARPLLGAGPGAFSNRFVSARLAAEERTRRHLVHRSGSAHFDNAHNEPLTLAAETGLPAALAAMLAVCALFVGLLGRRRLAPNAAGGISIDALFAALFAVALLSVADFPLRIAVASGPAAFLAGVAIRGVEGNEEEPDVPRRGGRAFFAALALFIVALAAARALATFFQAEGETLLREAAAAPEDAASQRAELLSAANARLARAIVLRPRSATALLAWGSVLALMGEHERAYTVYARSVRLEERAESDLNLGRAAAALGRGEEARSLFVRSVWIQPRLLDAVPPGERDAVAGEVAEAAAELTHGGRAPASPVPSAR